jgi:hypothetical protein
MENNIDIEENIFYKVIKDIFDENCVNIKNSLIKLNEENTKKRIEIENIAKLEIEKLNIEHEENIKKLKKKLILDRKMLTYFKLLHLPPPSNIKPPSGKLNK